MTAPAILLWAAAASGCVQVSGERILAGDLAGAAPAFASLPPDAPLGYAPEPGARRLFTARELRTIAGRNGLTLESPHEICVEREMERLTEERVLAALRSSLADGAGVQIEIVDFSRHPAPLGELEFPLARLASPSPAGPAKPVYWRGRVRHSRDRSFPVWAKVKVWTPGARVVAVETLPAGEPIAPGQVRVEAVDLFPFSTRPAASVEEVAGRRPRRSIRAGAAIYTDALVEPKLVERGDTVDVEVRSGAAGLSFQARAEGAGDPGEAISIRNPSSGRLFTGRVSGPGKVIVDANRNSALPGGRVSGDRGAGL